MFQDKYYSGNSMVCISKRYFSRIYIYPRITYKGDIKHSNADVRKEMKMIDDISRCFERGIKAEKMV
jgi:hypothetical protein